MKNGFKLMYQNDLSVEEKERAIKKLQWFVKTSFNPERYVEKKAGFRWRMKPFPVGGN